MNRKGLIGVAKLGIAAGAVLMLAVFFVVYVLPASSVELTGDDATVNVNYTGSTIMIYGQGSQTLNFTIQNDATGDDNITNITIEIPIGFKLYENSNLTNITSGVNGRFANSSSYSVAGNITWGNITGDASLINDSDTGWFAFNVTAPYLKGSYGFQVWVHNSTGTGGLSAPNNVTITVTDNVAPVLNLGFPVNSTSNIWINQTTFLFEVNVTEYNIDVTKNASFTYKRVGGSWAAPKTMNCYYANGSVIQAPGTLSTDSAFVCNYSLDTSTIFLGQGDNISFYFNLTDLGSNTGWNGISSLPLTATLDSNAPNNITYLAPADASYLKSDSANWIDFNFTVADAVAGAGFECILNLDGTQNTSNTSGIMDSGLVNLSESMADGEHIWSINCSDPAKNVNNSGGIWNVTLDNTAPANVGFPGGGYTPDNTTNLSQDNYFINISFVETNPSTCTLVLTNSSGTANYTMLWDNATACYYNVTGQSNTYNHFYVHINDSAGNNQWSNHMAVYLDTENPSVVQYVSPANNTNTTTATVAFTFKYHDTFPTTTHTGICTLYLNATSNGTDTHVTNVTNGTTSNITITFSDSMYTWNVSCNDSAGNPVSGEERIVTVDTSAPASIGFISPTPDNDINLSQDNFFVNVSFVETYTDTVYIELANTTGIINYTMTQGANDSEFYFNVTGQSNNHTYFYIYANDTLGNLGVSSARHVTVDSTTPVVYAIKPVANGKVKASQLVEVNVTEANLRIGTSLNVTIWYSLAGVGWTSAVLDCYDNIGTPVGSSNRNTTFVCNKTLNLGAWAENNEFWFAYNATDESGTLASNGTVTNPNNATADVTPPTGIGVLAPTPDNASNLSVNNYYVNISFVESRVDTVYLQLTNSTGTVNYTMSNTTNATEFYYNVTGQTDYATYFYVFVNDTAGNVNESVARHVTIDTTAPSDFSFISPTPSNDTNTTDNYFYVNVTFTETNLDACTLELTNYTGTVNYTMSKENTTTCYYNLTAQSADYNSYFYVYANSTAANLGRSAARHVTFDNTTPYNITYMSPSNNTNTTSGTAELNFTVVDNLENSMSCTLTLNGSVNASIVGVANNTETNFTVAVPDGAYVWNVTCNDSAGNYNQTAGNMTITVDSTPPTGTGFLAPTPANDTNTSQDNFYVNVSFVETYSDACLLELTNATGTVNYTMTEGANNTECYFNVSDQNFTYNMYFYVYTNDSAGQWNMSLARHVTFDNISPYNITYLNPAANANVSNETVEFNFTVVDDKSYAMSCTLTLNGSVNASIVGVANNTETNFTVTFPDGEWIWNVSCNDSSSNLNQTAGNMTLVVDTTKPTGVGFIDLTPANDTNTSQDNWLVNVSFDGTYLDTCLLELTNTTGTVNYTMSKNNLTSCFFNVTDQNFSYSTYFVAYTNDTAGNWNNSVARHVRFDNVSPSNITIVTANLSSNNSYTPAIYFMAWDNLENSMECGLWINESLNTSVIGFNNNTLSNFTIATGDGTYVINITCNDSLGNMNTTGDSIWLQISDTGAPSVTLNTPVSGSYYNTTMEINTTITDAGVGVDTAYFQLIDSSGSDLFTYVNSTNNLTKAFSTGFNVSFDTSTIADGTYTLRIVANDTNNNTNQSVTATIYIDNSVPGLMNWTYDYNCNLTLDFNDTMDSATLDITKLAIVSQDESDAINLTAAGTLFGSLNTTNINITLKSVHCREVEEMADIPLRLDLGTGGIVNQNGAGVPLTRDTNTSRTYSLTEPSIGQQQWTSGWQDFWLAKNTLAQISSLSSASDYTVATVMSAVQNEYTTIYALNSSGAWSSYSLGSSNNDFSEFNATLLGADPHYYIYMNNTGRITVV